MLSCEELPSNTSTLTAVDTMKPYLFTPLLFFLSAAAPAAEKYSHSAALQKRDVECSSFFGHGIVEQDCKDAMAEMRRMTPQTTLFPGTTVPIAAFGGFSRSNPDSRFRLPHRFAVRTCDILVDTLRIDSVVPSTWDFTADTANGIVEQCVHSNGVGGKARGLGLGVIIVNPANMDALLRREWLRCLDLVNLHANQNLLGHCILEGLAGLPAEMRTSQHRARAIEDTSALRGID